MFELQGSIKIYHRTYFTFFYPTMSGKLTPQEYGMLGSPFGEQGGRPSGEDQSSEQPYGMNTTKYEEIVSIFLDQNIKNQQLLYTESMV